MEEKQVGEKTGRENLTYKTGFFYIAAWTLFRQGLVWACSFFSVVNIYGIFVNLRKSIFGFTIFCIFYERGAVTIGYN